MKKLKTIGIHTGCWIVFFTYTYISWLGRTTDSTTLWLNLSINLAKLAAFYSCFCWVFPHFLKQAKIPQLIVGILVSYLLFCGIRAVLEEVVYPYFLGFDNYDATTTVWHYLVDNLYYGFSFIILAAAIYATRNAYRQERQHDALRKEAAKAEMAFLKSQINPHFLYNTLNYIYFLAIPVSDKLANAIVNLSDLMRYTLSESKDGKVEINREIDYIQNYIALFKLRFDPHFYVNFTTAVDLGSQRIAALLLIPFVENALKHGMVDDPNHPVLICLEVKADTFCFTVSNAINQNQKDISSGIGLANLRRRLELLYPNAHQLHIMRDSKNYKSVLHITF